MLITALDASVAALERQLAEMEEGRRQLKVALRRARNARAILLGEPVRQVGVPKRWSKETRAAQAERMREINEAKRREKAEARG